MRAQSTRVSSAGRATAARRRRRARLHPQCRAVARCPTLLRTAGVELGRDEVGGARDGDARAFDGCLPRTVQDSHLPAALPHDQIDRVVARRREPGDTGERIVGVTPAKSGLDARPCQRSPGRGLQALEGESEERSRVERLMPCTAMAAAPIRVKGMLRDRKISVTGARRLSRSAPRDIGTAGVQPVDGARAVARPHAGRAAEPGRRRRDQGRGRRAPAPGRPARRVSGVKGHCGSRRASVMGGLDGPPSPRRSAGSRRSRGHSRPGAGSSRS